MYAIFLLILIDDYVDEKLGADIAFGFFVLGGLCALLAGSRYTIETYIDLN